jgi:hypothetical protein
MNLTDLEPVWLEMDGKRVAIMFLCPHCFPKKRQWLTVFFINTGDIPPGPDGERGERALFAEAFRKMGADNPEERAWGVVSCTPKHVWKRTGDDFSSMSVTPSLDSSASGHWHGFITGGKISGGI